MKGNVSFRYCFQPPSCWAALLRYNSARVRRIAARLPYAVARRWTEMKGSKEARLRECVHVASDVTKYMS